MISSSQHIRDALLVVVHQLGAVDHTSVVHNLGVVSHRGVTLHFLVLNIFVSLKLMKMSKMTTMRLMMLLHMMVMMLMIAASVQLS